MTRPAPPRMRPAGRVHRDQQPASRYAVAGADECAPRRVGFIPRRRDNLITMAGETGGLKAAGNPGRDQPFVRDDAHAHGRRHPVSIITTTARRTRPRRNGPKAPLTRCSGPGPSQFRHDPSDNAEGKMASRVRIRDATPSSAVSIAGRVLTWHSAHRSTSRRRTDRQTYRKELRNGWAGIGGFVPASSGPRMRSAKGRQVNSNNHNYGGSETGAEDQAKTRYAAAGGPAGQAGNAGGRRKHRLQPGQRRP